MRSLHRSFGANPIETSAIRRKREREIDSDRGASHPLWLGVCEGPAGKSRRLAMNAVDVMTQPVISVTPEATIAEVAQQLAAPDQWVAGGRPGRGGDRYGYRRRPAAPDRDRHPAPPFTLARISDRTGAPCPGV